MSMWADCIREREGHEVIEEPWGFIEYHLLPPACEIDDLYVTPTERKKGLGQNLVGRVEKIAKDAGCTDLWAGIYTDSKNANDNLRLHLIYGFQVRAAKDDRIILSKPIGD